MRQRENNTDTKFYTDMMDMVLFSKEFNDLNDWLLLKKCLDEDLSNKRIYRPSAKKVLHLVKLKLNEYDKIEEEHKTKLTSLNDEELFNVLISIRQSPNFTHLREKIIKILSKKDHPKYKLACLLDF